MQEIVEIGRATQDELRDDLRELFQGAIRLTLEMVLEEELKAMVGARRFERVGSRKDHRNGTYLRRLLTSLGQIEVAMPRSRDNGSPADVIGRYQRRSPELDEMMVEAYVSGVSQRKMGDVTEALMGERVGRSTVSRVAKRLDEAVEGLRRAPIEGPHPYLYLDATFLDARWARKVENVSALVAYAVGPEGHRRLLAVTLGAEESQQSWSELLEQLQDRGLGGVDLVIADEHAGLAAAVRRFLPEARRQRCTVHLQRNVGARVPHRLRKRVAREVSVIFQTSGLAEAKKLLGEFGARWKKELPEAVEVLERGFGAATQFYAFPEAHWPRLRTTNSLERLHGEIKRRIKAAGAFPDRASALRLITAVALRTTHVWGDRRYLDLSLHHCPHAVAEPIVQHVVDLRQRYGWGSRKIRKLTAEKFGEAPARRTIDRIFERHDLITKKRRRSGKPGHPGKPLTLMDEPNAVWTVDFKGQFKMLNGRYCYPLTIQDGFSRRGYPFNSPNHYRLGLPPRI